MFSGYSINYSFRKNLNFIAVYIGTFDGRGIYKSFHHTLLFRIKEERKKWSITVNYLKGISRIWDTKDFDPDMRAYLKLSSFQITAGYII